MAEDKKKQEELDDEQLDEVSGGETPDYGGHEIFVPRPITRFNIVDFAILHFCANVTEMLCQFYKTCFFALPITDYFLYLHLEIKHQNF